MTPDEIVDNLSMFIIGQEDAKKAMAIALRSRWRRRQLPAELRAEVSPFNILMSGPTGTGKTEISRRLASLTSSPFIKTEMTKYTEVGIYGQNVESMVKDLVEVALAMEQERERSDQVEAAKGRATELILDEISGCITSGSSGDGTLETRALLRDQLLQGTLDDRMVEIFIEDVSTKKKLGKVLGGGDEMELPPALEEMISSVSMMLSSQQRDQLMDSGGRGAENKRVAPPKTKMRLGDAIKRLTENEAEKMVAESAEELSARAIENAEQNGMLFLDEIDKLGTAEGEGGSSFKHKGEGVQKELLALVEGCAVATKHGVVRTDHMLFVASGAFHMTKPSDLLPELQGRLPIRVSLSPLKQGEFKRILTETKFNLLEQMQGMLRTEGLEVTFTECAIDEMARLCEEVNKTGQDIGARRLHTIVSKVLEETNFTAHRAPHPEQAIDAAYVKEQLAEIVSRRDLAKYIL
jgi:ATP-dependent HslUV protease ATP-binding subunit HslU